MRQKSHYREKRIVLPMRHELAYIVKMWTYMLRISISFICMKYMLLLFFMNNVALDSQFYNGDIKSYLLPFFLDPKNNFQTEISLHQILKSKISTDIWVLQKDKINNNLENLMILKSAFQLFQPWGEMSIIRVGVSYLMVFSSSQPQDPWVALDSQGLHYYLLSAAKITMLGA